MPYTIPSSLISPGAVYQPRKSKLILDQITGAIAAWSTRRLISSAPADIARGRDASTNEQDFTAAELAGSGFTDLAGAGDGFYVTLYDQIGSNNATQSTAARQPKGVDTGTLITDGAGVPVLDFDGADDFLSLVNLINISGDFSITISFNFNGDFSSSRAFYGDSTQATRLRLSFMTGVFAARINNIEYNFSSLSITHNDNTDRALTLSRSGTNLKLEVSGIGSQTVTDLGSDFDILNFCMANNAQYFDGRIKDFIIFNRALSDAEITQLHTTLI